MRSYVFTVATLALVALPARGDLIINGTFENPAYNSTWITTSGGSFPDPDIIPPGWQGTGQVNVFRPSALAFPNGVPVGLQTGVVGDDIGPGTMFQDVAAVLTAGTTYTLTAFIGSRADFTGSGEVSLETVGGSILASSGSVSPLRDTFQEVTLSYTALSADPNLGQGLEVMLERTGGHQANFNDIQLSATPEPSSLALAALGLAGVAVYAAWRRIRSEVVRKVGAV
jgi:PEP-CTERM motif